MSDEAVKKAPGGRGSRVWDPYNETAEPPIGERAEGREMEFVELLAVMSAIHFFACRARLKQSEQDVLNAVLHHTIRYGRTELRASHGYLAKFTGYAPKTHGAPLKGLDEKGFIEYVQGSPKKSGTGHRHTQSLIRVRIPEGWEAFKDNSWVDRFTSDESGTSSGPFEDRPPLTASTSQGGVQAVEGLESRDLSRSQGLESRDPLSQGLESPDPKVSNLQTQRSRISRPYGLESRDHKGLESRGVEGLEIGCTKREDLERGDLEREASSRGASAGEPQTVPPLGEPRLGAATASPSDPISRPRKSQATHLRLVEAFSPEDGAENIAREALELLALHSKPAGRSKLSESKRNEIQSGIISFLTNNRGLDLTDVLYLLGLWAADRALENANHIQEHMSRNKVHLTRIHDSLIPLGRADNLEAWLLTGIAHGAEKRAQRVNANEATPEASRPTNAAWAG